MDVGGANPVQEEVLIPNLSWGLKNVASMVERCEQAVVHATNSGTFRPENTRLVRIILADSSRWADLSSLYVCFELKNESATLPLELICKPIGVLTVFD